MDNSPTNQPAPTLLRRRRAEIVCAAALLVFAANSLVVISRKNFTTDEAFMIPAGYYHLTARDFRPVNEHPPLVKLLSAAPLLCLRPAAPPHESLEVRYYSDPHNLYWTFWRANRERIDELSFWARVPAVLLTVLLGALVFCYARRLFGALAAVFAVVLFTLEPTVLAHGRVVQTDIPAALGLFLFTFALHGHLRAPTARRAAWVGAAAGLAVVMKFSMVVLAPVILVAFAAPSGGRDRATRCRQRRREFSVWRSPRCSLSTPRTSSTPPLGRGRPCHLPLPHRLLPQREACCSGSRSATSCR